MPIRLKRARFPGVGYFAVIVVLHLSGFAGLLYAAIGNPAFWGLGLLAYTYGLRHAFDADHIAAIDNTIRKLSEQKRSPLGVGFYFSLGHSSVVFLLVLLVCFTVKGVQEHLQFMQEAGGVVGMSVSGLFLVVMGLLNGVILLQLVARFRKFAAGGSEEELQRMLDSRGLLVRLFRPLFRFIGRSWHIYPLGFLFGLGFDTATEIGLLALTATATHSSLSVIGILSLPVLFASGMSLMDTADGFMMAKAYQWAFVTPLRKMRYNLFVTAVSAIVALVIGTVELVQVAAESFRLDSPVLLWIGSANFEWLGFYLTAVFVLVWASSVLLWKKSGLAGINRNGRQL